MRDSFPSNLRADASKALAERVAVLAPAGRLAAAGDLIVACFAAVRFLSRVHLDGN